ncbi:MAG: type IV pili methyl-accepting chemotaxis transducer N-terminal domain-containing protein, partial [Betaproteobacteria bacterium]
MAFKMSTLFGAKPSSAGSDDFDMPTTQVRMAAQNAAGYDPLATVSIMEQLRSAPTTAKLPSRIPVIGSMSVVKQFQVLGTLLALFLVFAALMVFLENRQSTQAATAAATATEMQMLSQRLARGSALASQGLAAGFPAVADSRERFRADIDALLSGGTVRGVSLDVAHEPQILALLSSLKARWDRVDAAAERLTTNQQSLTSLAKGLDAINQANAGLLELAQQGATQIGAAGGTLREVDFANQLAVLSQRIAKNANTLASSDEIDPEVAFLMGKDVGVFRDILNGLIRGSDSMRIAAIRNEDARATLAELQKRFASYDTGVSAILQNMQRLTTAKQAARSINAEAEPLLDDSVKLAAMYEGGGGLARTFTLWAAIIFAILALVCLVLLGKVFLDDARMRAFESEGENKRNQEAILRLLNEMGNLADGDLTVQASVTEDVTGAIADSINFTIEELRTLVRGINSATDQVTRATQETQSISNRLFEASQRQNREIQQASASVLQMAQAISEVAQNASQSAKVAQQALGAAEKGGQAVQNQISGMHEIRSQIQDTSKRIKRLGESS